jgi:hypothetical protein
VRQRKTFQQRKTLSFIHLKIDQLRTT